jgi:hypothetical protein
MFDHFCDMEMDFGRDFMLVLVEVVINVGRFSIFLENLCGWFPLIIIF